ncbi:MAG: hypothetical protein QM791_04010 [Ferruginibacter sp.]
MAPFWISVKYGYRTYRYHIEQTLKTAIHEQYTLTARNKKLVFQNNRPAWRNRAVRHRIDWHMVSGKVDHSGNIQDIVKAIDAHIRKLEEKGEM